MLRFFGACGVEVMTDLADIVHVAGGAADLHGEIRGVQEDAGTAADIVDGWDEFGLGARRGIDPIDPP